MEKTFGRIADAVARGAGRPITFTLCMALIAVWGFSGPFLGFSETWQLIINTSTTIVTFLMVFLIQNTQNRDGAAVQAKLDELVRVSTGENSFIGIDHLAAAEVEDIRSTSKAAVARAQSPETGRQSGEGGRKDNVANGKLETPHNPKRNGTKAARHSWAD
ncbi:low affinity iron permease family protein [Mesorhizobium sp. B3-2-1]|uniref:low affinity iron permease family protein n=1 Tax=unclassified Mesorhizobium TaxID=325217 RepID=UPI00112E880F|nr:MULTISPECIES: low affinity iron permease family protein [unclassified Mesorhizobium]MBZ9711440.1 low affinity iron permease family protein [Mesorhizobium sp. ESP7-2]TPI20808.1 low affinity iron permease family protein [Mesorhizobium sp. B3-2-1]